MSAETYGTTSSMAGPPSLSASWRQPLGQGLVDERTLLAEDFAGARVDQLLA